MVVVECNGVVVPSAVATVGFVNGTAEVTVSGLTPDTPYSLRCRCELEDPDVDPDFLWSPRVDVVTLGVAGVEVGRVQGLSGRVCALRALLRALGSRISKFDGGGGCARDLVSFNCAVCCRLLLL
jgi:hypothetical protein